jgi:hypothetical protein
MEYEMKKEQREDNWHKLVARSVMHLWIFILLRILVVLHKMLVTFEIPVFVILLWPCNPLLFCLSLPYIYILWFYLNSGALQDDDSSKPFWLSVSLTSSIPISSVTIYIVSWLRLYFEPNGFPEHQVHFLICLCLSSLRSLIDTFRSTCQN